MKKLTNKQSKASKNSFHYFLHCLSPVDKNNLTEFEEKFFDDDSLSKLLQLSHKFTDNEAKFFFVNSEERQIGLTFFLCFYSYYLMYAKNYPIHIVFITSSKMISYVNTVFETINKWLFSMSKLHFNQHHTKRIFTSQNKSTFKTVSDTTYNFDSTITELVIFDGAELKNYEKFKTQLDTTLNNYCKKTIINFTILKYDMDVVKKEIIPDLEIRYEKKIKVITKLIDK